MLTMWFAKDGVCPKSQSGPRISITMEEAKVIIELRQAIFVGNDAPSINPNKPNHSLKNVILEIESSTEVGLLFPDVGFYVVAGLAPEEALSALSAFRGQT